MQHKVLLAVLNLLSFSLYRLLTRGIRYINGTSGTGELIVGPVLYIFQRCYCAT